MRESERKEREREKGPAHLPLISADDRRPHDGTLLLRETEGGRGRGRGRVREKERDRVKERDRARVGREMNS